MKWTQLRKRKNNTALVDSSDCDARSEQLSRYLDNDLRGADAAALAAHLHGCVACRSEFETLRAQRAALRAAVLPRGSAAARARVLTRFEEAVRSERDLRGSRSRRVASRQTARWSMCAAGGLLVGVGVAWKLCLPKPATHPIPPVSRIIVAPTPPSASAPNAAPLPEASDLRGLLALHDARTHAALAAAKPPAPRPEATARRTRRRHAPRAAEPASTTIAATDASAGEPMPLPSDEIPEAL